MKHDYEGALRMWRACRMDWKDAYGETVESALRLAADWPHTADGVPVRFGMEVWWWCDNKPSHAGVVEELSPTIVETSLVAALLYSNAYSTAESCRAAHEKPAKPKPETDAIAGQGGGTGDTMTLDEISIDVLKKALAESRATLDFESTATRMVVNIAPPETEAQKIAKTFAANCAWEWPVPARRIQDAIDDAIAAERKACEEEARLSVRSTYLTVAQQNVAVAIADRIAARGGK